MSYHNAAADKYLRGYYTERAAEAAPYKTRWDNFLTTSTQEIWRLNMRYERIELPEGLHESFLHELYPHDAARFVDNLKTVLETSLTQSLFKRTRFFNETYAWGRSSLDGLQQVISNPDLWEQGTVSRWRQHAVQLLPDAPPKRLIGRREDITNNWDLLVRHMNYTARFLLLEPADSLRLRDDPKELKIINQVEKEIQSWFEGYRWLLGVTD